MKGTQHKTMRTPPLDPDLQKVIREHLADYNWRTLAENIGVTQKSVEYQLRFTSPKNVTYHFIGLLATALPTVWQATWKRYTREKEQQATNALEEAEAKQ